MAKQLTGPEMAEAIKQQRAEVLKVQNLVTRIVEASGVQKKTQPAPLQLSADDVVLLMRILGTAVRLGE